MRRYLSLYTFGPGMLAVADTCPALMPYQFGPVRNPDVTKGQTKRKLA